MEEKNINKNLALWTQDFTVTHYFVDPDGGASIHGLAFFIQEAAHNHATARSLGFEDLIRDNKAWVLTRQVIKVYRPPLIGDKVSVETWVQDTTSSFSVRDFHILSPEGEIEVIARTSWMMLDVILRRPVRIPDQVLALIPLTPGRLKEDIPLDKLPVMPESGTGSPFHVKYSDLDMNNHVNNITYIRWVTDDFDLDFRKKHRFSQLEMNYLNEAVFGDQLLSTTVPAGDPSSFLTNIRRVSDQKEIAIARTRWKERESGPGS